mmetsp:Transcript_26130/g.51294  ORF Transcript_26130/g.51294 Transcript_26130/m.51294 type:complete len:107 (+) Transcript_26130:3232-3552(+)
MKAYGRTELKSVGEWCREKAGKRSDKRRSSSMDGCKRTVESARWLFAGVRWVTRPLGRCTAVSFQDLSFFGEIEGMEPFDRMVDRSAVPSPSPTRKSWKEHKGPSS